LLAEDVEVIAADGTVCVYIWMVDLGKKADSWRLEWIIVGEMNSEGEDAA